MSKVIIGVCLQVLDVHSFQTNVSVPMSTFEPDTNYTAHLRSAPYGTSYKGVWSHWGPAIYWRTRRTKSKYLSPLVVSHDLNPSTNWLIGFLGLFLWCAEVKLDTAATGPGEPIWMFFNNFKNSVHWQIALVYEE